MGKKMGLEGFLRIFTIKKLVVIGALAASSGTTANDRGPAQAQMLSSDADIIKQLPPLPHAEPPQNGDGRKFPRLWFGSVRWEQSVNPVRYDLDQSLSPLLDLSYTFQLVPQLRTPDNRVRNLKEGYYLLRMVVLRPSDDEDAAETNQDQELYRRYVAGTERIVQMTQGSIRALATFRFHSISATALRNTLLIQIVPIKGESLKRGTDGLIRQDSNYVLDGTPGYQANVIRVPFIPRFTSGLSTPPTAVTADDVNVTEEYLDLGAFMRNAEAALLLTKRLSRPQVTAQNFAERLNLAYVDLNSREFASELARFPRTTRFNGLSSAELADELDRISQRQPVINERTSATLCYMLSRASEIDPRLLGGGGSPAAARLEQGFRQSDFTRCLLSPETHFTLLRQVHVLELYRPNDRDTGIRQGLGAPMRMTLAANFGTNRTHTKDVFSAWNQGLNLLFSPIDIKGVFRLGYTYTINDSNSRSKFEGTMASSGVDLEVHHWTLNFSARRSQVCTAVLPSTGAKSWTAARAVRGFYLCNAPAAENLPLTESFFHVFPSPTASTTIDVLNPRNQVVNMVLRGQRDYHTFLTSIQKYIRPHHDQTKNIALEMREAAQVYRNHGPALPTVVSYPVQLSGPGVEQRRDQSSEPGFWSRFFHRYEEKMN